MKNIILILFVLFLFSCSKKENSHSYENSKLEIRDSGLDSMYNSQGQLLISKTEYLNLPAAIKKRLWINKFENIGNQDYITDYKEVLINELIAKIKSQRLDTFYLSNEMKNIGVLLADQFSEDDFIKTFSSLDLNILSGVNTPICIKCKEEILRNNENIIEEIGGNGLPKCNCNWTCGDELASHHCTGPKCCNRTRYGCGFLWLNPCTGRDSLMPANPGDGDDHLDEGPLGD